MRAAQPPALGPKLSSGAGSGTGFGASLSPSNDLSFSSQKRLSKRPSRLRWWTRQRVERRNLSATLIVWNWFKIQIRAKTFRARRSSLKLENSKRVDHVGEMVVLGARGSGAASLVFAGSFEGAESRGADCTFRRKRRGPVFFCERCFFHSLHRMRGTAKNCGLPFLSIAADTQNARKAQFRTAWRRIDIWCLVGASSSLRYQKFEQTRNIQLHSVRLDCNSRHCSHQDSTD